MAASLNHLVPINKKITRHVLIKILRCKVLKINLFTFHLAPKLFDITALCISGVTSQILRRSICDQTMKGFIGRFT